MEDLSYAYFFATKVYYHADLALSPFVSDYRLGEIFTDVLRGTKNYKEFLLATLKRMPVSIAKLLLSKLKAHSYNSIANSKYFS